MKSVTSPTTETTPPSAPEHEKQPDLTGRSRMAWNVIVSWAGQFVFIVAGFIMPRRIDRILGQEMLGIWDFSWSMVAYFGLIQVGIGSSVNRYVAKYRARGEMERVSEVVSSVAFVQVLMGMVILGLAGLVTCLLPSFWGDRLGRGLGDAQVVLFTLGVSLALQVALAAFTGVITGCHRWDIHNYIKAGWYAATVAAMIVLLQLGLGIRSLAVASLVGLALADLNRVLCAFLLCPEMRIAPHLIRVAMARDAFRFGVKTLTPRIGDLLLNQTSSILIAAFLGPAALALYSRPRSLVQQTEMLVSKLAFVLTPTASALHSTNRREELGELLITATKYAAFISLPITIGLSIMGGPLLLLWMGEDYVNGALVAIIAMGSFSMFTLMPAMSILTGLNAHGRPGVVHLLTAICSTGFVLLFLGPFQMGLCGVALAVGVPLTIAYGGYVSVYACGLVGLSWRRFFVQAFRIPLLAVTPMALCLVLFRSLLPTRPLCALWMGSAVGGLLLGATYWRYVLPSRLRLNVSRWFRGKRVIA